ncbi:MAG TPA: hypothetical protein PKN04_15205 [bacterium]|nr:hypothetical protein [bacterium]
MKTNKWRGRAIAVLTAVLVLLVVLQCEQIKDPLSVNAMQIAKGAKLSDLNGPARSLFYRYETIFLTMENLYAQEQTDIQIIRLKDEMIIKRLLVLTDELGRLDDVPIWYRIGHLESGMEGDYVVHVVQPGINRKWIELAIPFAVKDYKLPVFHLNITDAQGNYLGGSCNVGEPVSVVGRISGGAQEIKFWVVEEPGPSVPFTAGMTYVDVSGDGVESVTTNGEGVFALTQVWSNPSPIGAYDVIADKAPFGEYNPGDLVADQPITGLLVQEEAQFADILEEIACDELGNYKNVFDSLETIFARVNPNRRPLLTNRRRPIDTAEFIGVFITPHKDVWTEGDSLVDIRTVGTFEMPIHCLWAQSSGSLPITRLRGLPMVDDPRPIVMWPGEYDVIIDVDRDTYYDQGTDILDGGPMGPGFVVPGNPPEVRFVASADIDFFTCPRDLYFPEDWTKVWGTLVDSLGTFYKDIPIAFTVVSGPGSFDADTSITSGSGRAYSIFRGGQKYTGTLLRLDATLDKELYTKYVLVFRKGCYVHNQGYTHNQGGF